MHLLLIGLLAAAIPRAPQIQMGTIEGTVTRAGTTVPIPGVQIRANGRSGDPRAPVSPAVPLPSTTPYTFIPLSAETITDGAGHFIFPDVPAGAYAIQASLEGYGIRQTPLSFGSTQTVSVTVTPGQRVQVRGLALIPASIIRGRVLDKDGRGMADVPVEVLRMTVDEQGRQVWMPMVGPVNPITRRGLPSIRTDERGEYQHSLLGAGDYYVRTILDSFGSVPIAVYYPETTQGSAAKPIVLGEGAEMVADIRIGSALETGTRKISGKAVQPLDDTLQVFPSLTLVERNSGGPAENTALPAGVARSFVDDGSGKFEFLDIRPGNYELFASAIVDGHEYSSKIPIEVRDRDIEDLVLPLHPAIEIKGRLVIDGDARGIEFSTGLPRYGVPERDPARSRAGDIRIVLNRKDGLFFGVKPEPVLDESGTSFTFRDVPEGDYDILASIVADGRPPSPDLYVADIRADGRSVFDSGLQVGLDPVGSIEVIVGTRGGSIEGTILGRSDLPAALILAPEASRRNNAALYRVIYTPRNGAFRLSGIVPGNYKIFAVPYLNEPIPHRSPEFLGRHESGALSVTIQKGDSISGLRVPFLSLGR